MRTRALLVGCLVAISAVVVHPIAARAAGECGPTGRLAVTTSAGDAIEVLDGDGGARQTVDTASSGLLGSSRLTSPSWSPDGRRLAYGYSEYPAFVAGHGELRVATLDGRHHVVANLPGGDISEAAWSPTGGRIAFVFWIRNYPVELATWSTLGDHTVIYLVDQDGRHLRPLLTDNVQTLGQLSWAPDGRHLAFANTTLNRVETLDVDAPVSLPRPMSPPTLLSTTPVWSPDGAHIAFLGTPVQRIGSTADLFAAPSVWVTASTGAGLHDLGAESWYAPSWSPDSQSLAISTVGTREPAGIQIVAADGKSRRAVTAGSWDAFPAWSRSDDRIAYVGWTADAGKGYGNVSTVDAASGESRVLGEPNLYGYLQPTWCA